MAVLSVKEQWTGEAGQWATDDEGKSPKGQLVRTFNVTVSSDDNNPFNVIKDPRIPSRSSTHPASSFYVCRGVTVAKDGPFYYIVTAVYKASQTTTENPLDEPADIKWKSIKSVEEIDEDVNGNPINTACGEPIEGIKKRVSDLGLTVTKNVALWDPLVVTDFTYTTNLTTFQGFQPGICLVDDINAVEVDNEEQPHWKATYVFIFRKPVNTTPARVWWARVRHQGKYHFNNIEKKKLVAFKDGNFELLNGMGMLRPDGTAETDPTIGHWLEFQKYLEKDLNQLELGI